MLLMLRIGPRVFDLVRTQSGFHVTLDPQGAPRERQQWRVEAHFVPAEDDPGEDWAGDAYGAWEYWRLCVNLIMGFSVSHWHDLERASFMEDADGTEILCFPTWQNLIHLGASENQAQEVALGELRSIKREGLLFTVELDGEILAKKGETVHGDFSTMIELPLATARIAVPLNATDPLATAKAIAKRELGLTSFSRHRLRLHDPERPLSLKPHRNSKHWVTLETAWR